MGRWNSRALGRFPRSERLISPATEILVSVPGPRNRPPVQRPRALHTRTSDTTQLMSCFPLFSATINTTRHFHPSASISPLPPPHPHTRRIKLIRRLVHLAPALLPIRTMHADSCPVPLATLFRAILIRGEFVGSVGHLGPLVGDVDGSGAPVFLRFCRPC